MHRTFWILVCAAATAAEIKRPAITGIANVALRVGDLEAARNFYGHVLGYEAAFSFAPRREESPPDVIHFKVNDRQYIQISPGLRDQTQDRLIHIGFETADARRLRDYLAARGVETPAQVTKDMCGNLSFTVKDPDGHAVEFVEYLPESVQVRNFGNFMPETRVSQHLRHVGIPMANPVLDEHFYEEILGFRRVRAPGAPLSFQVADGKDAIEFSSSHLSLETPDIRRSYDKALTRGYKQRDAGRMTDLYDPDGIRTELMVSHATTK